MASNKHFEGTQYTGFAAARLNDGDACTPVRRPSPVRVESDESVVFLGSTHVHSNSTVYVSDSSDEEYAPMDQGPSVLHAGAANVADMHERIMQLSTPFSAVSLSSHVVFY